LKYESLIAILPFRNVNTSQPLTSTFLPSLVVPVKSHSDTPRSPATKCRGLPKWAFLDRAFYRRETEPVFQTYELPLALFASPGWTPARLRDVRLVFDRTPSGVIALNEVGFSRPSAADE
jgi:hypothetical protein